MSSVITLSREAIMQAVKEYVERQGHKFVRFVPPESDYMKQLSDPGSIGVVVKPAGMEKQDV